MTRSYFPKKKVRCWLKNNTRSVCFGFQFHNPKDMINSCRGKRERGSRGDRLESYSMASPPTSRVIWWWEHSGRLLEHSCPAAGASSLRTCSAPSGGFLRRVCWWTHQFLLQTHNRRRLKKFLRELHFSSMINNSSLDLRRAVFPFHSAPGWRRRIEQREGIESFAELLVNMDKYFPCGKLNVTHWDLDQMLRRKRPHFLITDPATWSRF